MTTEVLIRIISDFQKFEATQLSTEKEFAKWLFDKHFPTKDVSKESDLAIDRQISYLLQRVGRLGRFFSKRTLAGLKLNSTDEFTLLNTIYNNPNISKNTLYQNCVIEISTGTKIINRFIERGFVKESISLEDKRVALLNLTNKGIETRNKAFEALAIEVKAKNAALNKTEKKDLLTILIKMDRMQTEKFLSEIKKL
jgi:DNA-binding MarR family transcriptional regulator